MAPGLSSTRSSTSRELVSLYMPLLVSTNGHPMIQLSSIPSSVHTAGRESVRRSVFLASMSDVWDTDEGLGKTMCELHQLAGWKGRSYALKTLDFDA
jgi:hypothetical protein